MSSPLTLYAQSFFCQICGYWVLAECLSRSEVISNPTCSKRIVSLLLAMPLFAFPTERTFLFYLQGPVYCIHSYLGRFLLRPLCLTFCSVIYFCLSFWAFLPPEAVFHSQTTLLVLTSYPARSHKLHLPPRYLRSVPFPFCRFSAHQGSYRARPVRPHQNYPGAGGPGRRLA